MSTPIIRVFAETAPTEGAVGTYQITLDTPAPAGGLTVNFNTLGSTATRDSDYYFACGAGLIAVTSSSFTIAEGATTATLNLVATTDYLSESDETVQVNLTSGVGYELVSFLPESSYSTPRYPFSLGVADFDGDGRLDFALSNFDNSMVSIYLRNDSNTGFNLEGYYPTAMRSQSIAVGDFNSDGKMDLAVTNAYGSSVSVLLRNGDNNGFDTTNYATGYYTAWVDTGDFDGDGQLDLVVTNRDSNTVSVLLRNADNTDFDRTDYATGSLPQSVTVADFDNDGKMDFAVANGYSHTISVFLRNADNTDFDCENYVADSLYPYVVKAGDFNDDGKMDIAVINPDNSSVLVLLRNEDNTGFDAPIAYAVGLYPNSISIGDFNNDDKLDIAVANWGSGSISILLRNADNTDFDTKVDYVVGIYVHSIAAGDFNADGQLDLVASYMYKNEISVLLNDGCPSATLAIVNNDTPVLTTPTAINYTDTIFDDTFATVTGFLVANDVDGDELSYGIVGGTDNQDGTISLSHAYGQLTVITSTGEYHFVADDTAIEALTADVNVDFTVTVSDGRLIDSEVLTVTILQNGKTESLGNDKLLGSLGDDKFDGLAGDDVICGLDGDDVIDGGTGVDYMVGGQGYDIYYVDNTEDVIKEYTNGDGDGVYSSASYTLPDNVEYLYLTGENVINGTGNELDNMITGNYANNILYGQAGMDSFFGDGGADTIYGGMGADTIYGDSPFGGWYLNSTADVLYGNEGDDYIAGHSDADTIYGGTGDDMLYGGLAWASAGAEYDDQSADVLYGGDGSDMLMGNGGADLLIGGLDKDNYHLEESTAATDTLRIDRGDSLITSYDVVTDFSLGTGLVSNDGVDKLDLEKSRIADNVSTKNGHDVGHLKSHHIDDGIVSFDDDNNYTSPLALTDADLDDVFGYLQANIKGNQTVAFICENDTFVFQDGGVQDTVVELIGVIANSINNTGLGTDAVWIV